MAERVAAKAPVKLAANKRPDPREEVDKAYKAMMDLYDEFADLGRS